jgi:hypothetical protein
MMAQTHPDKNTLLHNFAKTFAGYLKSIESSNKLALFDDTLHHFNKV